MNTQIRKRIVKALHDFKADMVSFYHFDINDEKTEEYERKAHEAETNIAEHPIYKEIMRKGIEADQGDHFDKIENTDEEEEFMKTNPYYIEMMKNIAEQSKYEGIKRDEFAKRLKHGKASPEEQLGFDNAEMKIWENSEEFFGSEKNYHDNPPMITFDSVYYEILNGYWGWDFAEEFTNPLNEKLGSIGDGYHIEPYDYSTWVVVQ